MKNTAGLNTTASETTTLGAQVDAALAAEFDVIRQQRGDRFISDTIRAALEEFRRKHWRERLEGEVA